MPWQSTDLFVAPVEADGTLGPLRKIAGGPDESIVQPAWSPSGELHFISDRSGVDNIWSVAASTSDVTGDAAIAHVEE